MRAQVYAAAKGLDYDLVDPDYENDGQPDYDQGADPDYDEGAQRDYDTDYADPDSGDAGSQEYRKRSQK